MNENTKGFRAGFMKILSSLSHKPDDIYNGIFFRPMTESMSKEGKDYKTQNILLY